MSGKREKALGQLVAEAIREEAENISVPPMEEAWARLQLRMKQSRRAFWRRHLVQAGCVAASLFLVLGALALVNPAPRGWFGADTDRTAWLGKSSPQTAGDKDLTLTLPDRGEHPAEPVPETLEAPPPADSTVYGLKDTDTVTPEVESREKAETGKVTAEPPASSRETGRRSSEEPEGGASGQKTPAISEDNRAGRDQEKENKPAQPLSSQQEVETVPEASGISPLSQTLLPGTKAEPPHSVSLPSDPSEAFLLSDATVKRLSPEQAVVDLTYQKGDLFLRLKLTDTTFPAVKTGQLSPAAKNGLPPVDKSEGNISRLSWQKGTLQVDMETNLPPEEALKMASSLGWAN